MDGEVRGSSNHSHEAYLQTFIKLIRHISAAKNKMADYLSRVDFTVTHLCFLLHRAAYTSHEQQVFRFTRADPVSSFLTLLTATFSEDAEDTELFRAISTRSQTNRQRGVEMQRPVFLHDRRQDAVDEAYISSPGTQEDSTHSPAISDPVEAVEKIHEACKAIHNGRVGHHGAAKTWRLLNKHFPGHAIPFKLVHDFIMSCPICLKTRLKAANSIPPMYRTTKTRNRAFGIDHTSVTPKDSSEGYNHLTVIVDLFSGLTRIYPRSELSAGHTAECIVDFMSTYGLYTEWRSDPGSDFVSLVLEKVTKYLGLHTHVISLVDRHESNGVERVIAEVLRHLRALVNEERTRSRWAKPTTLRCIEFILNNSLLSERGNHSAYQLTLGSDSKSNELLDQVMKQESDQLK